MKKHPIDEDERAGNPGSRPTEFEHGTASPDSIAGDEGAGRVLREQGHSAGWAATHARQGLGWLTRSDGDKAENMARAIGHFEQSLSVEKAGIPADLRRWIWLHEGIAWMEMPGWTPDAAQRAIDCFEKVLDEGTTLGLGVLQVEALGRTGACCLRLGKRDAGDNMERAIAALGCALRARPEHLDPLERAVIHRDMGRAMARRLRCSHAENVLQAIQHFESAMAFFTEADYEVDWANLHLEIANAILGCERGLGEIPPVSEALEHLNLAETTIFARGAVTNRLRLKHLQGVAWVWTETGAMAENLQRSAECEREGLEAGRSLPADGQHAGLHQALGLSLLQLAQTQQDAAPIPECLEHLKAAEHLYAALGDATNAGICLRLITEARLAERILSSTQSQRRWRCGSRYRTTRKKGQARATGAASPSDIERHLP